MEMAFEWDFTKAELNLRKHGVCFKTAALIFEDPFHFSIQDHFENSEYRRQTIGAIRGCIIALIAHRIRFEGGTGVIRIMSARKACRKESKIDEHHQI